MIMQEVCIQKHKKHAYVGKVRRLARLDRRLGILLTEEEMNSNRDTVWQNLTEDLVIIKSSSKWCLISWQFNSRNGHLKTKLVYLVTINCYRIQSIPPVKVVFLWPGKQTLLIQRHLEINFSHLVLFHLQAVITPLFLFVLRTRAELLYLIAKLAWIQSLLIFIDGSQFTIVIYTSIKISI